MYLSTEEKQELFAKHGKNEKDTGSTEGQIALMTKRIQHISNHLKRNPKDFNSERTLIKTVGRRRNLIKVSYEKRYYQV